MVSAEPAAPDATSGTVPKPQDLRVELVGIKLNQMLAPLEFATQLREFKVRVAASFEAWLGDRQRRTDVEIEEAKNLLLELAELGANDRAAPPEAVQAADSEAGDATVALLRMFALVPAWQSGKAPLGSAPTWLLPLCAAYHFSGPRLLTEEGQAQAYARDYLSALRDLARLAAANRGAPAIRSATECFRRSPIVPPAWAGTLWAEISAARGKLLSALTPAQPSFDPVALPREGRRLRVGVIATKLNADGIGGSILPLLEQADRTRFELILLASNCESPAARQLRARGADAIQLTDTAGSTQTIRDLMLDAAFFVAEPAAHEQLLFELAQTRLAPLQIWYDGTEESPALRQMDLYLAAAEITPPPAGAEPRAALLPGIGATRKSDLATSMGEDMKRAEIGVADDATLLVSFAPYAAISPETQRRWARILRQLPDAKLLLCSGSGDALDSDWVQRFCETLEINFVSEGAASSQAIVLPEVFGAYEARKRIIAAADLVLDAPESSDAEAILAAAECAVPVVALRGATRRERRAATLLASATVDELVADADGYEALAVRLASDDEWRTALGERMRAASAGWIARHDSFALSEAFGSVLERGFDAIAADRKAFARTERPLAPPTATEISAALVEAQDLIDIGITSDGAVRARFVLGADGANPAVRGLLARALRMEGQHAQAVHLLVSQLDLNPLTPEALHEVALAAYDAGQPANAINALKTALELDPRNVDSLLLLGRFNDPELRREVASTLRSIAADDPRVQQTLAEWGA